jgi:hypothetical protein
MEQGGTGCSAGAGSARLAALPFPQPPSSPPLGARKGEALPPLPPGPFTASLVARRARSRPYHTLTTRSTSEAWRGETADGTGNVTPLPVLRNRRITRIFFTLLFPFPSLRTSARHDETFEKSHSRIRNVDTLIDDTGIIEVDALSLIYHLVYSS